MGISAARERLSMKVVHIGKTFEQIDLSSAYNAAASHSRYPHQSLQPIGVKH